MTNDETINGEVDQANAPEDVDFQREVVDRRLGTDRRQRSREESGYTGPERRVGDRRTGLERRRGAGIRREEDRRSAEEGEMTAEQFEFVQAIETFKRRKNKPFPTWIDVHGLVCELGYRAVERNTIDLSAAPLTHLSIADLRGDQADFVKAIEAYKAVNKKRFPTWTEVLEVVLQLGYRKVQARGLDLASVPEAPFTAVA